MKVYLFILFFLLLGAFFIITEHNLALKNTEARVELGNTYLSWVGQVLGNSVRLTGYVAKLEWLPKNLSSAG